MNTTVTEPHTLAPVIAEAERLFTAALYAEEQHATRRAERAWNSYRETFTAQHGPRAWGALCYVPSCVNGHTRTSTPNASHNPPHAATKRGRKPQSHNTLAALPQNARRMRLHTASRRVAAVVGCSPLAPRFPCVFAHVAFHFARSHEPRTPRLFRTQNPRLRLPEKRGAIYPVAAGRFR